MLLETGGDAMRWARRAFHEKSLSYDEMTSRAASAPAGSDALFFAPYLTGERLGAHRNARAQFFGLGAGHGLGHLHRAILEGVAFAAARHLRVMEHAAGRKLERVIASGGGAKTELWLKIKASVYGVPIVVPKEAECGVVGCAAMAATARGCFSSLEEAIGAYARYVDEVRPDPVWAETYARMQPVFDKLYFHSQALYDDLDALSVPSSKPTLNRRPRRGGVSKAVTVDERLAPRLPGLFAGKRGNLRRPRRERPLLGGGPYPSGRRSDCGGAPRRRLETACAEIAAIPASFEPHDARQREPADAFVCASDRLDALGDASGVASPELEQHSSKWTLPIQRDRCRGCAHFEREGEDRHSRLQRRFSAFSHAGRAPNRRAMARSDGDVPAASSPTSSQRSRKSINWSEGGAAGN